MRIWAISVLLSLSFLCYGQDDLPVDKDDKTSWMVTNDGEILRFSYIHLPGLETTDQNIPSLPSCMLHAPDKLPMFCEMEKRLTKATNIWMMIRLESNFQHLHQFNTSKYRP